MRVKNSEQGRNTRRGVSIDLTSLVLLFCCGRVNLQSRFPWAVSHAVGQDISPRKVVVPPYTDASRSAFREKACTVIGLGTLHPVSPVAKMCSNEECAPRTSIMFLPLRVPRTEKWNANVSCVGTLCQFTNRLIIMANAERNRGEHRKIRDRPEKQTRPEASTNVAGQASWKMR